MKALVVIVFTLHLLCSCKKSSDPDNSPKAFAVVIDTFELLNYTRANISVTIQNANLQGINQRGVCWDVAEDPTVDDPLLYRTTPENTFTETLQNLHPFTKYYVRGFVTTNNGTYYSNPATFTTKGLDIQYDKEFVKTGSASVVQVIGDDEEGFIVLAKVLSAAGSYPRLTEIDGDGNEVWSTDFFASDWKEPRTVHRVSDGYVITATHFQSGDVRVVLIKTDLLGNLVWHKDFKKDAFQYFMNLGQEGNNLVLVMRSYQTIANGVFQNHSLWKFVVDLNGNITSEQGYPNFNALNTGNVNVYSSSDDQGGFVGAFDIANNIRGFRLTADNTVSWLKDFGTQESKYISATYSSPNGNFVIGGVKESYGNSSAWITEIDKLSGNYIWQFDYVGLPNRSHIPNFPTAITHSGNYFVAGRVDGGPGVPFLINLDNTGKLLWDYTFPATQSYRIFWATALYVSPARDIYLFGSRYADQSANGVMCIVKLKET